MRYRSMLLALIVLLAGPVEAGAIVVYENPFNSSATDAGMYSRPDSGGGIYAQLLAQRFVLASSALANRASWYGTMGSADPLNTGDTWAFDLIIYEDSFGLPGAIYFSARLMASVTDTGIDIQSSLGAPSLFERAYRFDVVFTAGPDNGPLGLTAGTDYWFSVVNQGNDPNTFRWTEATIGLESAISTGGGWSIITTANRTPFNFSLELSPVSEPDTLLQQLHDDVTGPPRIGPGESLGNKIGLAQVYYAVPDIQATCAVLTDFLNEVRAQRSKKIETALADQLTADAQAIMDAIGCD